MAYLAKQDMISNNKDYTLSGERDIRYCDVVFTALVWSSTADVVWLRITDGATTTDGTAHDGEALDEYDGSWKTLTVNHTISEDATELTAVIYLDEPTESLGIQATSAVFYVVNYNRSVVGGCPCCGTYMYDPAKPVLTIPDLR